MSADARNQLFLEYVRRLGPVLLENRICLAGTVSVCQLRQCRLADGTIDEFALAFIRKVLAKAVRKSGRPRGSA